MVDTVELIVSEGRFGWSGQLDGIGFCRANGPVGLARNAFTSLPISASTALVLLAGAGGLGAVVVATVVFVVVAGCEGAVVGVEPVLLEPLVFELELVPLEFEPLEFEPLELVPLEFEPLELEPLELGAVSPPELVPLLLELPELSPFELLELFVSVLALLESDSSSPVASSSVIGSLSSFDGSSSGSSVSLLSGESGSVNASCGGVRSGSSIAAAAVEGSSAEVSRINTPATAAAQTTPAAQANRADLGIGIVTLPSPILDELQANICIGVGAKLV